MWLLHICYIGVNIILKWMPGESFYDFQIVWTKYKYNPKNNDHFLLNVRNNAAERQWFDLCCLRTNKPQTKRDNLSLQTNNSVLNKIILQRKY